MTLFTTKGADPATRTRLARQQREGRLRRLHEGVYTDDLVSPPETIVRREVLSLLAILVPDSVVSHRSALESGFSAAGDLFLTGPYRRRLVLPGMTLRIEKGAGPLEDDIRLNTPFGPTYRASEPRAFLENLSQSRGAPGSRRTLGQAAVEARLERIVAIGGADSLNTIRDRAKRVAGGLGLEHEASRLDAIIGALLGTREAALEHPLSRARARGAPYDSARVDLFQGLATRLATAPPVIPPRGRVMTRDWRPSSKATSPITSRARSSRSRRPAKLCSRTGRSRTARTIRTTSAAPSMPSWTRDTGVPDQRRGVQGSASWPGIAR